MSTLKTKSFFHYYICEPVSMVLSVIFFTFSLAFAMILIAESLAGYFS